MTLAEGGLLGHLSEARLTLVALHPEKDVQGQPYIPLKQRHILRCCSFELLSPGLPDCVNGQI